MKKINKPFILRLFVMGMLSIIYWFLLVIPTVIVISQEYVPQSTKELLIVGMGVWYVFTVLGVIMPLTFKIVPPVVNGSKEDIKEDINDSEADTGEEE